MAITVKLENPPGTEIQTRNFDPGQNLRIGVNVPNTWPGVGANCKFQIEGTNISPMYFESSTDVWGNAWWDANLPNVNAKADIIVIVSRMGAFGTGDIETTKIPIAIGNVTPEPIKPPADPSENWKMFLSYMPWIVGISAVSFGVIYLWTALPRAKSARKGLKANPKKRLYSKRLLLRNK